MSTLACATAAAGAFATSNVDTLVALTAQLSGGPDPARRAPVPRLRQALCGQYLALLALLTVSALAAVGLDLLPVGVAPLAGLVPVGMGVHQLIGAIRRPPDAAAPVGLRSDTWAVALMSLACGADNIAVYSPLLANARYPGGFVALTVLAVLVLPLCVLAAWLSGRKPVPTTLTAMRGTAAPVCLIAVGVLVLNNALA